MNLLLRQPAFGLVDFEKASCSLPRRRQSVKAADRQGNLAAGILTSVLGSLGQLFLRAPNLGSPKNDSMRAVLASIIPDGIYGVKLSG